MNIEKLFSIQPLPNATEVLLHKFCDKDRGWMAYPFTVDGKAFSTDGYCIFMTMGIEHSYPPLLDSALSLFKSAWIDHENINKQIHLQTFKSLLSASTMIEGINTVYKSVKCPACEGDGDVTFTFDFNRKEYETEAECPICEGTGDIEDNVEEKSGEMVIDGKNQLKVGCHYLYTKMIIKLIEAAMLMGIDTIYLVNESTKGYIFKLGECKLLMMASTQPENVIGTIDI